MPFTNTAYSAMLLQIYKSLSNKQKKRIPKSSCLKKPMANGQQLIAKQKTDFIRSPFFYFSHSATEASDDILRSPRGESDTVTTFGPSGIAERLNCCEKKRRRKTCNQCFISSLENSPQKAFCARNSIFAGEKPLRKKL